MFWWFERGGQYLRYETRNRAGGGYELRVVHPDGVERVENFVDSADLAKRQVAFEQDLVAEGWSGPYGWNL